MANKFAEFFVLSVLCGLTSALDPNPSVILPWGKVNGYFTKTNYGNKFAAFEGIPYAEPPIGANRFKEPKPAKPWQGVWHAVTMYKCIQYNHFTEPGQYFVIGDEDCLYLNVYTPENVQETSNLDVIVFIHGGAFMFGSSGSFGPKILMDRNIICITLNYRLGPLGFLSTEDAVVPGNNGIRDQNLALKWIKQNIKYFGGNPNSITLTGMSAGSASVQIHYLSPPSKGLFNRGISQSGTALNPCVLMENGREKMFKLADIVGCPTNSSNEAVDCLRTRPAKEIVNSVKYFQPWLYNPHSPFGVVVDRASNNPVLPDHPYTLLKQGRVQDLPHIFSNTHSEGLYPAADFVADEQYLRDIDSDWNKLVPFILDYNYTVQPQDKDIVSQNIRDFYLQDKPVTNETFLNLVDLISDRLFIADIQKAARMQSAATKSPVYYYYFSYRGAHSKSEMRSHSTANFGAAHGDDTIYILSSDSDTQSTADDRQMSSQLLDMWLSFASSGKPALPNAKNWPHVSKTYEEPLQYVEIKSPNETKTLSADNLGNHRFWSALPLQENENLCGNVKE